MTAADVPARVRARMSQALVLSLLVEGSGVHADGSIVLSLYSPDATTLNCVDVDALLAPQPGTQLCMQFLLQTGQVRRALTCTQGAAHRLLASACFKTCHAPARPLLLLHNRAACAPSSTG